MNYRKSLAAAILGVAGACFAAFLPMTASAGVPPADVSAEYFGKGSYRITVIAGEEPGKGKLLFTVSASQEGNDLSLVVSAFDPLDESTTVFNCTGRVGNGKFWVFESDDGDQVFLTGTAKGSPGKLKLAAKGHFFNGTHYSEIKFSVKQVVEVE